jgi:hypothetical protein
MSLSMVLAHEGSFELELYGFVQGQNRLVVGWNA